MSEFNAVNFKLLRPGSKLPKRGTDGSGAFDIYAPEGGSIMPGCRGSIPTGLAHEICQGYTVDVAVTTPVEPLHGGREAYHYQTHEVPFMMQGLLIPRSGLASKKGVRLFFAPCLIDNDYRGEIDILLENVSDTEITWEKGDRLVQIAYVPMYMGSVGVKEELTVTARGTGGHGHTGLK